MVVGEQSKGGRTAEGERGQGRAERAQRPPTPARHSGVKQARHRLRPRSRDRCRAHPGVGRWCPRCLAGPEPSIFMCASTAPPRHVRSSSIDWLMWLLIGILREDRVGGPLVLRREHGSRRC
jgi:hypothetical protein